MAARRRRRIAPDSPAIEVDAGVMACICSASECACEVRRDAPMSDADEVRMLWSMARVVVDRAEA